MMEDAALTLAAGVRISVPLLLLILGEIYAERSGVLNVGLEGLLLTGALGAFAGSLAWGHPWAGLALAVVSGLALSALFAFAVVARRLDQIVCGVALNILALGVTGVLFRKLAEGRASLSVAAFETVRVPGLSTLPSIGPVFTQSPFAFVAFALVPLAAIFLYRTRPGLLIRAAGENPAAVDAAGISVARIRVACVLASGALAGVAGAYLSTSYTNTFVEGMSDGRGFMAIAIVVFTRWDPWRAGAGALLFGCSTALGIRLQGEAVGGVAIPYQFFQALPYLLTLAILALGRGRDTSAPHALGTPFRRGAAA